MEPLDAPRDARTLSLPGRELSLPGPLSEAWQHAGLTYVLAGSPEAPRAYRLSLYDAQGALLRTIAPPEGWLFDRLAKDLEGRPVVIAWTDAAIHGHNDWQHLIDPETGALTRTHPSR